MASKPLTPKTSGAQKPGSGPIPVERGQELPGSTEAVENLEEGVQEVHEELRKATVTQITLTTLAVLAICYFAKLLLVTIFTSILIAYILEPLVRLLKRMHVPRGVGSAIAVLLAIGLLCGLGYFFFQRAIDFAHQLPKMQGKIRQVIGKYENNAEKIQQTTQNVIPEPPQDKNAVKVKVEQPTGIRGMLGSQVSNIGEIVLTVAFIPFLVYFMLTWQEHTRKSTVRLFPAQSRAKAYITLGKISEMVKGFIVGNFAIGIFMSIASGVVFALLHLPYFYFLGLISGFLSLIPYLGVVLALVPPLASGVGVLHSSGILIIVLTIFGLHIFSLNVLYPKVIGGRLELNPLAVTLALLIWGWIWGAMGLILAVPVVGTIKIICDNIEGLEGFGQWLGEGQKEKPAKAAA